MRKFLNVLFMLLIVVRVMTTANYVYGKWETYEAKTVRTYEGCLEIALSETAEIVYPLDKIYCFEVEVKN